MGKRAKSKGKAPTKVPVPSSPRSHLQPKRGDSSVNLNDSCEHFEKDSAMANQVLLKIRSSSFGFACEDCRDEPRVGMQGKGKENKSGGRKKGGAAQRKLASATPVAIWVCLECSHSGCSGDADISKPYGHARRHHKQSKHAFAVKLDDPRMCWCFSCDLLIRIEVPEVERENKLPNGVGRDSEGQEAKAEEDGKMVVAVARKGYVVRGILNLGNTCFFNSIMQNLFAMDMMREYFLTKDTMAGPLSMALKKLFVEIGSDVVLGKGIVNPKSVFGCISSKAPQFRGHQQQDSHELLRYLLDGLSTEEESSRNLLLSSREDDVSSKSYSTFVDALFGGQISSMICCVECGHTSVVYEPFLDLSLSLPSKKVPPKKLAATQPKKGKLSPNSRGRRGRERAFAKIPDFDRVKEEKVDTSLKSGEHSTSNSSPLKSVSSASSNNHKDEQAETTSLAGGAGGDGMYMDIAEPVFEASDEASWLDFVGPVSPNYVDALRDAENMGFCEIVNSCQKMHPAQEPELVEESIVEKGDASVKPQSSEILLHQYQGTELTSKVGEMTLPSQKLEMSASVDNPMDSTSKEASFSSRCGAAEVEFDGIGDLFAEPEVASDSIPQEDTIEDQETTWFSRSGNEYTEEIVDDADAPVSIDRCLAYFTKPELLSGEHAWHCENCWNILTREKQSDHKQTAERNNVCEMWTDAGSNQMSTLNDIPLGASYHSLKDGKLTDSANWVDASSKNCEDADTKTGCSEKHLNIMEAPSMLENSIQHISGSCSSPDDCQKNCRNVSLENGDVVDSCTSMYFSCNSSVEKEDFVASSSGLDVCSCHNNNQIDGDACVNPTSVESFKVSSDCMEETSSSTRANGKYTDSQEKQKKGAKIIPDVHNKEVSDLQNMKVKRDASKRILIHKAPPILTIHLKRFGQDARGRLNKLCGHVTFQEMLDLAPYMDQSEAGSFCYRLVGVVEHSGTMRGGHYVAYVRGQISKMKATDHNSSNRTWFYISDVVVREASLSEVLHSEAYILFFERIQL